MKINEQISQNYAEHKHKIMGYAKELKTFTTDGLMYKSLIDAKSKESTKIPHLDVIGRSKEDKEFMLWEEIIRQTAQDSPEYLISFIEHKDEYLKMLEFLCDNVNILTTRTPIFEYKEMACNVLERKFPDFQKFIDLINQEESLETIVYSVRVENDDIYIKYYRNFKY